MDTLRKERKQNYIKCSNKNKKGERARQKRERKNESNEQKTTNMVDINLTILVITLNVSGLIDQLKQESIICI